MSTFGQTGNGENGDWYNDTDTQFLRKDTLSEAGSITRISLRLYNNSGSAQNLRALLYAADGAAGIPGTLLRAEEFELPSPSGWVWIDVDLASAYSAAAADYWHGAQFESNGSAFAAVATSGATSRWKADTYSDGALSPYGGGGNAMTYDLCSYVTYTVAGGAAALWVPSHYDGGLYERMAGGV